MLGRSQKQGGLRGRKENLPGSVATNLGRGVSKVPVQYHAEQWYRTAELLGTFPMNFLRTFPVKPPPPQPPGLY